MCERRTLLSANGELGLVSNVQLALLLNACFQVEDSEI